mgnify:CR=1 FL=1
MQQSPQQTQPTPQQVFEEGYRLFRMGEVFEAAKRAGKLRMHFPDDIPILTLHGLILAKMGIHPQALSDLIKAAQLTEHALENDEEENPSRPRIVDQLIRLSVEICRSSVVIGEYAAATEAIENALKWDPDRGDAVAAKAQLLAKQGKADEALALIAQGQTDKLDLRPLVLGKAGVLLEAESPDKKALNTTIKELETESQVSGLGALDLGDLLRTIGMVHDRIGNHDEAFSAFRRAAKLRRGTYDPRSHTMMSTKVIHDWDSATISKLVKPEQSGERFVLVLGAPHSGVGELSEMLAQIDDVTVVGPLESLSSTCVRHLGARQGVLRPVPFDASKLRGGQLKEANETYTNQIVPMMGASSSRGIDTHPHNIPLAGAAAAFMPGIHIVMCRRDPMESTLATYCDAMIGNHPYAGDLINAAGYVADSNRMLDHWASTLGEEGVGANVVQVKYADLVSDPKKTAAKVAREIGLDARATSIKHTPAFDRGPGAHPDAYESFTKAIEGFFDPASS